MKFLSSTRSAVINLHYYLSVTCNMVHCTQKNLWRIRNKTKVCCTN